MRRIHCGQAAITGPIRRPLRSSCTAMALGRAIRSAPCGRPACTAWRIGQRRASGSTWRAVVQGQDVACQHGGKEVHAADVAKAVEILLTAVGVEGEAYSCCDRYVS